jgi:Zn-dependent peptidase ImmA (M78 family)
MEWQAGYVCGALLMPVSSVRKLVQSYLERYNLYAPLHQVTPAARNLINQIAVHFAVSQDAARVRLIKLGSLTEHDVGPTLFG